MAEICCGVVNESDPSVPRELSSRAARRRRMEIRRFKFVGGVATPPESGCCKRQKTEAAPSPVPSPRECENAVDSSGSEERKGAGGESATSSESAVLGHCPKYGMSSVCGRRREMEDAVSIHPSFFQRKPQIPGNLHFFGVYDGHGCSHVAMSCKDRMHGLLAEELGRGEVEPSEWKEVMERSFLRMDMEVVGGENNSTVVVHCRCEKQTPDCDAVGSTAVVAVVGHDKIVVANCGDSRAVLCRNGKPVPLSSDHKPDRPDELQRIQAAGGRVIFWDGPRVLGVLAMSRAIGDNYLKPFVSSEPEVTVTYRSPDDECLILASDGLWDVVSNSMACDIARMCLRGHAPGAPLTDAGGDCGPDKACSDAAILLTKLALARHSTDNVSVVVVDLRRDT
ncbi:probable protein phosphatase 2C 24 [Magnolia sinica]|uniref:probable protein phosphatase 2C 24 n=1 Tax=Magnolia sinica TaxID=86752 RepID=UPI002659388F|nr:probable protein phosphatase 2C 24 [Magnolia sinica]